MKQSWIKLSVLAAVFALLAPASLLAQKDDKEKDKELKTKKESDQIIITRKGDSKEKVVIEINGDKVTINGTPLEEYKDKDGNVSVMRSKRGDYYDALGHYNNSFNGNWNVDLAPFRAFGIDSNRAMLGVTTEQVDKGVQILTVNKECAAQKAGLKEKDVITKVDGKEINSPDELSEVIQKHKAGDKVDITYLRDNKEQKATAELGRWKGSTLFNNGDSFKMDLGDLKDFMPRAQALPRKIPGQSYTWSSGGPKLGLSVQDTDDGKGVKVIEVDDESNAQKAGLKNDDVITEVDGKAVNSADEIAKVIRDSKDKTSVMMKLTRSGKTQNVEVKIPRKLKTADF